MFYGEKLLLQPLYNIYLVSEGKGCSFRNLNLTNKNFIRKKAYNRMHNYLALQAFS